MIDRTFEDCNTSKNTAENLLDPRVLALISRGGATGLGAFAAARLWFLSLDRRPTRDELVVFLEHVVGIGYTEVNHILDDFRRAKVIAYAPNGEVTFIGLGAA